MWQKSDNYLLRLKDITIQMRTHTKIAVHIGNKIKKHEGEFLDACLNVQSLSQVKVKARILARVPCLQIISANETSNFSVKVQGIDVVLLC